MIALRPLHLPADQAAIVSIDTSFTTERIYRLRSTPLSFTLEEVSVVPPIVKAFPLTDELEADAAAWDYALIAEERGRAAGWMALQLQRWNRRAVLWHLYVAPEQRRKQVGRRLAAEAIAFARKAEAHCLWLETTNLNYPGIQFYLRLGFSLCGLDTRLYDPSGPAAGEIALYLAYDLRR